MRGDKANEKGAFGQKFTSIVEIWIGKTGVRWRIFNYLNSASLVGTRERERTWPMRDDNVPYISENASCTLWSNLPPPYFVCFIEGEFFVSRWERVGKLISTWFAVSRHTSLFAFDIGGVIERVQVDARVSFVDKIVSLFYFLRCFVECFCW